MSTLYIPYRIGHLYLVELRDLYFEYSYPTT